ncbi:MAG: alpha-rhamnosidase [Saprospiraceae bacterium]|nr:alpha-rhamnosidase [Saprospiraceae bacterium]
MTKIHSYFALFCLVSLPFLHVRAQKIEAHILQKQWKAYWITVPNEPSYDYGVYMFRKKFDVAVKPSSFVVHVSADNRYKLFVNEKLVSLGPARGDLSHWNFETVDLSPYLKSGTNILAALVWNEGTWKPEAQISLMTGFILQGATDAESIVNTNGTWKCRRDGSFEPLKFTIPSYYVSGAGEIRRMATYFKTWQRADFVDAQWQNAKTLFNGAPKNVLGPYGTTNGWMLVPSAIPPVEMKEERFEKVVFTEGGNKLPPNFPKQKVNVTIPPLSIVTILLDQSYLTNAYPTLQFSGGRSATISMSYAEALYTKFPAKGHRDEVKDKVFLGRKDSLISDGSEGQQFTPLTYRTYRYVQIKILTQSDPLVINDIFGTFTGYPFEYKAKLEANNAEMTKILDIGWRTARLCAVETYMDCPYYEQLQYIGDARIQALVSLYNTGDERLVKNALNLMDYSRQPEGVTLSRHPSYTPQYIPTFSLWYIGMLHDYSRYGRDLDFVKQKLGGVREILRYFKQYQQADGSLQNVPQWMFTDWVEAKEWKSGVGPMGSDGTSAMLDLQLLLAYQVATDLESRLGMPAYVKPYQEAIEQLTRTIWEKYWDNDKKLFADRIEKDVFSQHTNTLAILTGVLNAQESALMAQQLLNNKDLAPASIYFKYYLHLALAKAGLADDYIKWLNKWRENIQMGLTTWAEISEIDRARSDCHAWGSSPNIEFFRILLGIDSDDLGFSKVKIEPHLGDIKKINGQIPHPKGTISVNYEFAHNQWNIQIELPKSVTGTWVWKGKSRALKEGMNTFVE